MIVDLQLGEPSGAILDEVRLSPSNRTAVTFGIGSSDPNITNAFRQKSDFFFERPLSAKSIRNTLKPAYSLILRERRRYFRYPVSVPVFILRKNQQEVRCSSVNVSEGGMALSTFVPFIPGETCASSSRCRSKIATYPCLQKRRSVGEKLATLV